MPRSELTSAIQATKEWISNPRLRRSLAYFALFLVLVLGCKSNPYIQGERLYTYHCSSCHMSEGEGMAQLYPPLAEADYLDRHAENLPCIIRFGLTDTIIVNGVAFDQPMEGNKALTHAEIANICNYIMHRWHAEELLFSESNVSLILTSCTK